MMIPTVHMNGTAKADLEAQLQAASDAVRLAMRTLADAGPNGRDYYPQGPQAFAEAQMEHNERMSRLRSVLSELTVVWDAVADGGFRQG